MLAQLLVVATAVLSVHAVAVPQLETRQTPPPPEALVTFWRKGCGVDPCDSELGCQRTIPFGGQSPAQEEECFANPSQEYRALQLDILNDSTWEVDVFSGDGCNNFVTTVTRDSCYLQPDGQVIVSFRARRT